MSYQELGGGLPEGTHVHVGQINRREISEVFEDPASFLKRQGLEEFEESNIQVSVQRQAQPGRRDWVVVVIIVFGPIVIIIIFF